MLVDASGNVLFVYYTPLLRFNNKTITGGLEWDPQLSLLHVDLTGVLYPLAILFELSTKLTDSTNRKGFLNISFGKRQQGGVGESSSDGSESENRNKKTKSGGFKFGLKLPSLKFGSAWLKFLFGEKGVTLAKVPSGPATLTLPDLGFQFSLPIRGEAEVSGTNGKWKLGVSLLGFSLPEAELFQDKHVVVLKHDSEDTGFSSAAQGAKHFFTISRPLPTGTFSLKFKVCGSFMVIGLMIHLAGGWYCTCSFLQREWVAGVYG